MADAKDGQGTPKPLAWAIELPAGQDWWVTKDRDEMQKYVGSHHGIVPLYPREELRVHYALALRPAFEAFLCMIEEAEDG